jgi:hypothetical protein
MFVSWWLAYRRTNQLPRLAHDGQILTRGDDEDTYRRGWLGNISVRLASFAKRLNLRLLEPALQTRIFVFVSGMIVLFVLAAERSD